MPAIIIEGINGVGKSTLTVALAKKIEWPIYKPFREKDHNQRKYLYDSEMLRRANMPVNSCQEDVYVLDFIRSTGASAILDRSLPSAMVYGELYKQLPADRAAVEYLMEVWMDEVKQSESVVVFLFCSYKCAKDRAEHMPVSFQQYAVLTRNMAAIIDNLSKAGIRCLSLDTSSVGKTIMVNEVFNFAFKKRRAK